MKTFLALLLCCAATWGAAPIEVVEISSHTVCEKLPPALSSACLANEGSKTPFKYAKIAKTTGCYSVKTRAQSSECLDSLEKGSTYVALLEDVELPSEGVKAPEKTDPLETIAASTKAMAIIAGIYLGMTVVALAVTAFVVASN